MENDQHCSCVARCITAILIVCAAIGTSLLSVQARDTLRIDPLGLVYARSPIDTLRMDARLAVGLTVYAMDPDRNRQLAKDACADAESVLHRPNLNNSEQRALEGLKAMALNNKAVPHFIYGELDSAQLLFAEKTYALIGPAAQRSDAQNKLGSVHGMFGNSTEQGRYLREALKVHLKEGDTANSANARLDQGDHLRERGTADSAMHYFHIAVQPYETLRAEQGRTNCALTKRSRVSSSGMLMF